MLRVSLALLANWLAHVAWYSATHDPTPYQFSIITDFLTAVVVLARPSGRMQSVVGASLLVQIGVSFGYWLHMVVGGYTAEAEIRYWTILDWSALAQILLVGMWSGDGLARYVFGDGYNRRVPWHRAVPEAPDRQGVAQP